MEQDPFSNGPRPSYLLESDSEESDWDDLTANEPKSASSKLTLAVDPTVSLKGNLSKSATGKVVFLVGEGGEWVAKGVEGEKQGEGVQIWIDDEQVGHISQPNTATSPTLVFLTSSIALSSQYTLSSTLFTALSPTETTIISTYYVPSYLPPPPNHLPPPMHYLSPSSAPSLLAQSPDSQTLTPLLPPNLVHGVAASLLTVATVSSLSAKEGPGAPILLLLPTLTPLPQLASSASTLDTYGGLMGGGSGGGLTGENYGMAGRRRGEGALDEMERMFEALAKRAGWAWYSSERRTGTEKSGDAETGFTWLERRRKEKRKEMLGAMYM